MTACVGDSDEPVFSLSVGDNVPTFSVTLDNGMQLESSDLRGHKSVIVFFNTSCSDCRRELPMLQSVYNQLPQDVTWVCIARDEDNVSISEFWEDNSLTMPYSAQRGRDVYDMFASSGIPRIYIIGEDLHIAAAFSPETIPAPSILLDILRNI